MVFARKLLVILVSVWSLATLISVASGTMTTTFNSAISTDGKVPQELVASIDAQPSFTLPPHVRLAGDSEQFLTRYNKHNKAAEYTGFAVDLVRNHLNHLYSGDFEAARKDWHPKGNVLHIGDAVAITGSKVPQWANDQPIQRSATRYIDAMEKYRNDSQLELIPPPTEEGPWAHPFSALKVTVLQISTSGVLISVDQPLLIDIGEPAFLDNSGFMGPARGYRSMLFMVQVGYILEGNQGFDPESGIANSIYKVRLHHVSLAPIPGC